MKVILFGGSGEVGGAVARSLIESSFCKELTLIGRRKLDEFKNVTGVIQHIVDTSSDDFERIVKEIAAGHDAAVSCIGIGSGTYRMSEEQMMEVEVRMAGKYARGCRAAGIEIFELLTAFGVSEKSASSKNKYLRVLGKKYRKVLEAGFPRLAVFKPGMIVGNKHTPRWMTFFTALIPDSIGIGNIRQEEIGRAFAAHLEKIAPVQTEPVIVYGNKEMKQLIQK